MKKILLFSCFILVLSSCKSKQSVILSASTNPTESSSVYEPFFDIEESAPDKEYGLVGNKPIKVGDRSVSNQRRYIASLAGPNGEELSFFRRGSCCPYSSKNGFDGTAFVDVYEVTYQGLKDPILLYISFYDLEKLYIPNGFTKRNQ